MSITKPKPGYIFRQRMRALVAECRTARELVWVLSDLLCDDQLEVWDVNDREGGARAGVLMDRIIEARRAALAVGGPDVRAWFLGYVRNELSANQHPTRARLRGMFSAAAWMRLLDVLRGDAVSVVGLSSVLDALEDGGAVDMEGERGDICTPPMTTRELADRIGLEGTDVFRKKGSKWRGLFEKYRNDATAQIPLCEVLPLVKAFYSRKGWKVAPRTEGELEKLLMK